MNDAYAQALKTKSTLHEPAAPTQHLIAHTKLETEKSIPTPNARIVRPSFNHL